MFNVKQEGPLYVVYDDATNTTIKECQSASEAAAYVATEKAGDVGNLAKHLLKKHGAEHLFTACMSDEATAEYSGDARKAVCARVHHEAIGKWPSEKEMKEMDTITEKASDKAGDYLIVEDEAKPTTWHLQVKKDGKPDHGLMGGAWAALHEGYRGNKYAGPNKGEAISKLRKLYEAEKMPVPGESEAKKEVKPNIFEQVIMALKGDSDKRKNGTAPEPEPIEKEGRRNSGTDEDRLQQIHDLSIANGAKCMVMKDAKGASRWVLISTNAYEDRDGEYVSLKAQKRDVQRMTDSGAYGPLRLWHLGYPDVSKKEAGPGVDIGDCDYSQMFGKFRIESGTFRNERVAAAIKERADQWGTSVGFFHSPDDPDREGVYHEIYTFERSLLPKQKASNSLTPLASVIKEINDMTTKDEKIKQLTDLLGGDDLAKQVLGAVDAAEKQAQERGLTYKQQSEAEPKPAEVETKSGDKKDDDGDDDDMDGMDEATAKAYKAMLPHIVKTIHALTKGSNIEDAAAREARAAKKEAKQEKAKAKRKELNDKIAALEAQLKELQGDQPRVLSQGFRASQSDQTILNPSMLKEVNQADPLGEFLKGLGMLNQR